MYKKLFLLTSLFIPFVGNALRAFGYGIGYGSIPGPWYTYWLKTMNIEFTFPFLLFLIFLIILLGLLSLFFKGARWQTFKKLIKGLVTLIILGNIIWFLFANIYSQFNPRLNMIYSDSRIPSVR